MARKTRKKKQEEALSILGLFLLLAIAALVLAPVAIIFYKLYLRTKLNEILPHVKGSFSDFWLDKSEKSFYVKRKAELAKISEVINTTHITAQEHNISINKDGSYSRRSNIGKEVCDILEKYTPYEQQYKADILYLKHLPQKKWNEFHLLLAKSKSCMVALAGWIISYIAICLYYDANIINTFIAYVSFKSSEHYIFIISGLTSIIFFGSRLVDCL